MPFKIKIQRSSQLQCAGKGKVSRAPRSFAFQCDDLTGQLLVGNDPKVWPHGTAGIGGGAGQARKQEYLKFQRGLLNPIPGLGRIMLDNLE